MASVREERAYWAHQLHATLLNTIGAVIVQSQVCEQAVRTALPGCVDEVVRLRQMLQALEDAARTMAASAAAAPRNPVREVRDQIHAFTRAHPHLAVVLSVRGGRLRASRRITTGVGIVLSEALLNAVRHGRPAHIEVDLAVTAGSLLLRVRDDGRGFDPALPTAAPDDAGGRPRCGMAIMRTWAGVLGGRFAISSVPGRGTQVTLHVPIENPAPRHAR